MYALCRPRPCAVKEKDVWEESRWGGRLSEWGHDAETGREREGERERSEFEVPLTGEGSEFKWIGKRSGITATERSELGRGNAVIVQRLGLDLGVRDDG